MSVKWEEMHKEGNRPWDLKGVTPMLRNFFENDEIGRNLVKSGEIKRILVPGCGQKNDSEYLGKVFSEAKVVGADISPTSIKICKEEIDSNVQNVEFIEADFFKSSELGGFDLIFDHTFFCAISPSMRKDWGARMAALIRKDGHLLTIIYPLPRDPENVDLATGPPFEITFAAYEEVLSGSFECIKKWENSNLPASNEKRKGREELAFWRHF